MASNVRVVRLPRPVKGVLGEHSPVSVPPDGLLYGENIHLTPWGTVRLVKDTDFDHGTAKIQNLHSVVKPDATTTLGQMGYVAIRDDGGMEWEVEGSSGHTDSTVFSAYTTVDEYPAGVAVAEDYVYITKKIVGDSPHRILHSSGTPATSITATTFDGTSSRFPLARTIAYKDSVMFAGNVYDGTSHHDSRLHWSNIADVETWDAADYIDFDPGDGQPIQKVIVFGEDLLVFKSHKIFALSGRSEASYTKYTVSSVYGTQSPSSVAIMDDMVIFYDPLYGVMAYNGAGFAHLSQGNDGPSFWESTLTGAPSAGVSPNYNELFQIAAAVSGDTYALSAWGANVSDSDYPTTTHLWDRRSEAWTQVNMGFTGLAPYWTRGVFWVASPYDGSTRDNGIHVWDTWEAGSSAADSELPARWRTGSFPLTEGGRQVRIRRITLYVSNGAATTVKVSAYLDDDNPISPTYSETVTLPSRGAYSSPSVVVLDGFSQQRARLVSLEFEVENPTDTYFELADVEISVSDVGGIRGDDSA